MTSSAGFQLVAGRIPGERIATSIITVDSATFTTTETELQTVTASLVSGRIYRVRWAVAFATSSGGTEIAAKIREDDVSGTELQTRHLEISATSRFYGTIIEAEYTALATADKTFSFTGDRTNGTGNLFLRALETRPVYAYVDYIRE